MKSRMLLMLLLLMGCFTAKGQNYNYVIPSTFQPLSYSQIAAKVAYEKQMFDKYYDEAYSYYNKGDMQGFIYYSDCALKYGFYSNKMYYDRGVAYERLRDYKRAKKNYKKAMKKGYYPASQALESCKVAEKIWKSNK